MSSRVSGGRREACEGVGGGGRAERGNLIATPTVFCSCLI